MIRFSYLERFRIVPTPEGIRVSGRQRARRNALLVAVFMLSLLAVLGLRFIQHQLLPERGRLRAASLLARRAPYKLGKSLAERALRGPIFDRHHQPLAISFLEQVLVVDPTALFETRSTEADIKALRLVPRLIREAGARLRPAFQHGTGDFQEALFTHARATASGSVRPVRHRILTRGMAPAVAARLLQRLKTAGLAGFSLEARQKRIYPQGSSAVQVVGSLGVLARDQLLTPHMRPGPRGLSGVEQSYERWLKGHPGSLRCGRDVRGREWCAGDVFARQPRRGHPLVLTLDSEIQRLVHDALERHAQESMTVSSSAVVLSVASGEVLAIASHPSWDPEGPPGQDPGGQVLRAVSEVYTPGSAIKPLFLSWALAQGVVSTTDRFDCGGSSGVADLGLFRPVKEFSPHPGLLNLHDIIMHSSNIGAVRICSERLGLAGMYQALEAFEVGRRPLTGLPRVARGHYTPWRKARPGVTARQFPMGYEMGLSPLSLARIYLILARYGAWTEPVLIKEGGQAPKPNETSRSRRVLAAAPAAEILRDMRDVVEGHGTGRRVRSRGWTIAAKTGTGQDERQLSAGRYNAWLCAIAPATRPRIVVVVHTCLKRLPGRPYTGGAVSGPVAKIILEGVLSYLQVPRDKHSEEDGLSLQETRLDPSGGNSASFLGQNLPRESR